MPGKPGRGALRTRYRSAGQRGCADRSRDRAFPAESRPRGVQACRQAERSVNARRSTGDRLLAFARLHAKRTGQHGQSARDLADRLSEYDVAGGVGRSWRCALEAARGEPSLRERNGRAPESDGGAAPVGGEQPASVRHHPRLRGFPGSSRGRLRPGAGRPVRHPGGGQHRRSGHSGQHRVRCGAPRGRARHGAGPLALRCRGRRREGRRGPRPHLRARRCDHAGRGEDA